MKQFVIVIWIVVWGNGFVGTGVALDERWGTNNSWPVEWISKGVIAASWPVWIVGYEMYKAVRS